MINIILPLLAVGLLAIMFINKVKRVNKKRKSLINDKSNKRSDYIEDDYMSMGMTLGMCFGVALGSAFTSIFGPEAISYGICFGMLGGLIIGSTIKKK
ncbi:MULTISPECIES: DUF2700 domain-containing protein [unclassified Romboutsia]|uniref:DUF2700 domain-containing protein n=1 Tax=unclassified Romboutsia TaxID=2626894 RepID=UPI0008203C92|nr:MULTISPECIES: DUF2700 domain-containing protein [unclassified Romboutsia]SCH45397.1 Uncharacterised protein [uncultured Clostridium sp.]